MSNENRVIVMEITIPHARTSHMGDTIITAHINDRFISRQNTVHGQRK